MEKFSNEEMARSQIVIEQYGGIISYLEAIYIDAVLYAAERSEDAFYRLDIALSEAIDPSVIFGLLQEALGHAAAVSRFFWPPASAGKLGSTRGKRLREAFAIDDKCALKSRILRNTIEHYDEKLDRFCLRDMAGTMFPRPIIESINCLNTEYLANTFKLIDPKIGACILLGQRFDYFEIHREIQKLIVAADTMDRNGGRLGESRNEST